MRVQYKMCIDAATMELRNVRPEVHLMCMYVYKHVCMRMYMYVCIICLHLCIYTYILMKISEQVFNSTSLKKN